MIPRKLIIISIFLLLGAWFVLGEKMNIGEKILAIIAVIAVQRFKINTAAQHEPGLQSARYNIESLRPLAEPVQVKFVEGELTAPQAIGAGSFGLHNKL